jgi:carbon monoxide dehydrogenase subunit G
MILEGKFTVDAELQKLWDVLFANTAEVGLCVPGMESLTPIDDKSFDCVFKQKVGPLKIKMIGKELLTKVDAPNHIEMAGSWADVMKLGTANNKIVLDLVQTGNSVSLEYKIDVSLAGKLNALGAGDRLMKSQGTVIEREFVASLQTKIKGWLA